MAKTPPWCFAESLRSFCQRPFSLFFVLFTTRFNKKIGTTFNELVWALCLSAAADATKHQQALIHATGTVTLPSVSRLRSLKAERLNEENSTLSRAMGASNRLTWQVEDTLTSEAPSDAEVVGQSRNWEPSVVDARRVLRFLRSRRRAWAARCCVRKTRRCSTCGTSSSSTKLRQ